MQYLVLILSFSGIVGAEVTKDNARAHYYAHGHESVIRTTDWKECFRNIAHKTDFAHRPFDVDQMRQQIEQKEYDKVFPKDQRWYGLFHLTITRLITLAEHMGDTELLGDIKNRIKQPQPPFEDEYKYRNATMLKLAVSFGFVPLLQECMQDPAFKQTIEEDKYLLCCAATSHCLETAQTLLAAGASLPGDAMLAASSANDPEMLKLLIAHGGDINACGGCGMTPIMECVTNFTFCFSSLKLLLEKGADVNAVTDSGDTALDTVRWRIDELKDKKQHASLDVEGRKEHLTLYKQLEKILLRAGAKGKRHCRCALL